jgi:hypothetical protein
MENYGTVEYKGKTLTLTQQPYICDLIGSNHYVAMAEDEEGNEYEIKYPITNPECEDESESCDWTDFSVRKFIV